MFVFKFEVECWGCAQGAGGGAAGDRGPGDAVHGAAGRAAERGRMR
jgi:hypothetical protein